MNMFDSTFSLILIALAAIAGVMLLSGHGEILMKGGNSELRDKIYDRKKFERATGVAMLIIAAVTGVDMFTTTPAAKIAYVVVLVIVFVGLIVYLRKKCRKQ